MWLVCYWPCLSKQKSSMKTKIKVIHNDFNPPSIHFHSHLHISFHLSLSLLFWAFCCCFYIITIIYPAYTESTPTSKLQFMVILPILRHNNAHLIKDYSFHLIVFLTFFLLLFILFSSLLLSTHTYWYKNSPIRTQFFILPIVNLIIVTSVLSENCWGKF